MDFDQLNTFVEVAKNGSFSLAGRKVFRSQSAVSAQIRQLELEYGEKLFGRVGKAVRLTPAGEVPLEYARRMIAMRQESHRAMADQAATPRGKLLIGANEATCLYVLPDVFAEYQRLYPAVQISIYRNFGQKILQKVEDGWIDVGIVTLPVKSPGLKVFPIFRDRVVLMTSPRIAGAAQVCERRRHCGTAAYFSEDRIHAAAMRQIFSAVPLATARGDGIAEREHDQAICCGGAWRVSD